MFSLKGPKRLKVYKNYQMKLFNKTIINKIENPKDRFCSRLNRAEDKRLYWKTVQ